ncbi:cysteine hydrolase [Streptomyces sp. WAC06614]|uniref:cysteine hydrolase n=1 Tax=Streptomyces sp. WAC06614 TaxID=2487416 RepID=UPI000F7A4274|nr:cysteine hydrolase [Streptomyces sp. WAC06614]RSS78648.1 cysteine hydrolase [Streptomyces sp. WAC06614]
MRTALIGLDYIVDIMHPDGKIARCAPQAAEREVVARFNAAKEFARAAGWPTVLVKVGFEAGYRDQPKHSPLFGRAHEFGALDLTGPGTAFHPDLHVDADDIVIAKPRVSAFYGTRLDQTLSASGIERVVVCGVSTVWAVQATARDAHDRDYRVVVAEDACAALTAEEHDASVRMLSQIAEITTTDALSDLA